MKPSRRNHLRFVRRDTHTAPMPYALADTIRRCARHDSAMEARRVIVVGSTSRAFSSSLRGLRGIPTTPLIAGAAVGAFIVSALPVSAHVDAAHATDQPSVPPAKAEPAVSKQEFMRYARRSLPPASPES